MLKAQLQKRVGMLQMPAKFFNAKTQLNASPTHFIVVYTIVIHVRYVLFDCNHSKFLVKKMSYFCPSL